MNWIAVAKSQHPEHGDAAFQIVTDDEVPDSDRVWQVRQRA